MPCLAGLALAGCASSNEAVATAALVALPISYFAALAFLALFLRLWRPKLEEFSFDWALPICCGVVLLLAWILSPIVDPELLVMGIIGEGPFLAAIMGVFARAGIGWRSSKLMQVGPVFAAALVAAPNIVIFNVPDAGDRIVWLEFILLLGGGRVISWLVVGVLLLEAVLGRAKTP